MNYRKTRLVTPTQIATELGWTPHRCKWRLGNHAALLSSLRRPGNKYDARAIDVLRKLYGQAADQPRDFLADYLMNKEINDRGTASRG